MPAAKKKTTKKTKRTTTSETARLKNTIALHQRDLADALNREKAAKDRTRAVTKELEQVRANAVGMADWLQRVTTEAQVREEQRQALAEKYVNTTLDAHEIAKYAVQVHEKALLAEDALAAADEYIERLRANMRTATSMLRAVLDAMAQAFETPREVVFTLVGYARVTEEEGVGDRHRDAYHNRVDRYECKEELTTLDPKIRDYATMPVDKVKMHLDDGLPVAAKYQWKGGTPFYGECPPPATIVAMASMQEGTSP